MTDPRASAERPGPLLTGALMAVIEWWLEAGMPHPPERMNDMLGRLVAGALAGAAVQGGHPRGHRTPAGADGPGARP